ncbi:MAG: ribonuclease Z [Clostridia bacterium]|nr:ribonuclease Z [Clostridia bacterium]
MKIKFFGTGHGVPAKERYCQCILVEVNGANYVFDVGAPIADLLHREETPFNTVKGIFVTHLHADHITGIFHFLDLASWYYRDVEVEVYLPEKRGVETLKMVMDMYSGNDEPCERIRTYCYDEKLCYRDENICVSAIATKHMGENNLSYGFIVKAEGKQILISGDLKYSLEDYPTVLDKENFDFVIFECAHFEPAELLERARNAKTEKMALVHVFPLSKYDTFKNYSDTVPFEMIYPEDGEAIKL